ncbi:unnamed protein product [Moneuplotes crassus]|uniref:Uncharacterized protein n=1 Tax=Euplotes crassus TaxID=5936 RepID=A0AAD1XKY4_EUPCR|nr:unnamed protein product [Moneuplotes crassus]
MEYQQLYKKACEEISRLQENVSINKQVIENLVLQLRETDEKCQNEIMILNKIISDHHKLHNAEVGDLKEQLADTKDALEMKEYLLQEKENKWKEFEDVIVSYANQHPDLQEKLSQIDYLCDEVTSQRKISNVVKENEDLKAKITSLKSQLSEVVSNMTHMELEHDEKTSPKFYLEPCTAKSLMRKNLHFANENEELQNQYKSGNMSTKNRLLEPPCMAKYKRNRFGSTNIPYEENSKSTDEGSRIVKSQEKFKNINWDEAPESSSFGNCSKHNSHPEAGVELDLKMDESSIDLDCCAIQENSHPSQIYFDRDEVLDDCLEVLSRNDNKEGFENFADAI